MPLLDAHYSDNQYLQSCDVCGRPTIIAVEMSGERVGCCHCGGSFLAVELPQKLSPWTSPTMQSGTHRTLAHHVYRLAASLLTAISNTVVEQCGL